jgi:CMP-N-acetylneuraminic acid synthetase
MSSVPQVLAVIPARAGSKGLPGKNTMELRGRPILRYTLDDLAASRHITHVVAVTNDPVFRKWAQAANVAVIDEPETLAADDVPIGPVLEYALDVREHSLDFSITYDAVVIAEVSTPVRPPGIFDRCLELLWSTGAEVVTTIEAATIHPPEYVVHRLTDGRIRFLAATPPPLRRQECEPLFHIGGACAVLRRHVIGRTNYLMSDCAAIEYRHGECVYLDEPFDVAFAEFILERRARWKGKFGD